MTGAAGNLTGQMIAGEVKSAKDVVSALGAGAAAGIIGKGSADLLSKEFQLYFQTLTRAQQKNILNNIGHITNRELTQIRQAFKQGIGSTELDELLTLPTAKAGGFSVQPPPPAPARSYTVSPSV